jgi:threonine/homoserine/homoserine lactone efflux protein
MPTWEAFVTFIIASLVLIAIPGPSVMFSVGRSLALGKKFGVLTVLGNAMGTFVWIVLVAVGLGAVIASSEIAYQVIRYGGAAYLIYLGIMTIVHRHDKTPDLGGNLKKQSVGKTLREAFIVGVSNPKTAVFFLAVLPQFVNYSAGNLWIQMLVLGLIFEVLGIIGDMTYALAAGYARDWLARNPRRLTVIITTGGAIIIALGLFLALVDGR